MAHNSKILMLGLMVTLLVTVRCISGKSFALQMVELKTDSHPLHLQPTTPVSEIEKLFGKEALGSTYYAISPDYFCIKNGERIPSWQNSLFLSSEGKLYQKGDRCTQTDIEIRDLSTISVVGDGSALAYRISIYDRVASIPKHDPGLHAQRYTEAFCTLDHETMPNSEKKITKDLHFHVYHSPRPNDFTYALGTGETPHEWAVDFQNQPMLSRTVTERVLFYQFNNEFSAYVSIPGAVITHTSLFTTYNSRHVTGTGKGLCFLNTSGLPKIPTDKDGRLTANSW